MYELSIWIICYIQLKLNFLPGRILHIYKPIFGHCWSVFYKKNFFFFLFSPISLHVYYTWKKLIDNKMTLLNSKKTEKIFVIEEKKIIRSVTGITREIYIKHDLFSNVMSYYKFNFFVFFCPKGFVWNYFPDYDCFWFIEGFFH